MPCYKSIQAHQAPAQQSYAPGRCFGLPTQCRTQRRTQLRRSQQQSRQRCTHLAAQQTDSLGSKAEVHELLFDAAQPATPSDTAEVEEAPVLNVESPSSDAAPMLDKEPSKGRATPVISGIKNATLRYDLPTPAVAVRNLVELAQYAHLCTIMSNMHHRRAGYPFGAIVDFASDGAGCPLFCLSPLAIHTRNIMEDPRCSLVVQMPGWHGMANARVTIFGDVYQLPPDMHERAREIYVAKHASNKKDKWVSGNLLFFRMNRISDIYFVGGFGTVQWVDVADYMNTRPDSIVAVNPQETIEALNEQFDGSLRTLMCRPQRPHVDEVTLISIDKLGADARVRVGSDYSVERIGWQNHVHSRQDACKELEDLINIKDTQLVRPRSNVRTRL